MRIRVHDYADRRRVFVRTDKQTFILRFPLDEKGGAMVVVDRMLSTVADAQQRRTLAGLMRRAVMDGEPVSRRLVTQ